MVHQMTPQLPKWTEISGNTRLEGEIKELWVFKATLHSAVQNIAAYVFHVLLFLSLIFVLQMVCCVLISLSIQMYFCKPLGN